MHKLLFTDDSCWVLAWGNASEIDSILKERCFPSPQYLNITCRPSIDCFPCYSLCCILVKIHLWKWYLVYDTLCICVCHWTAMFGTERETRLFSTARKHLCVIICVCNNALCFSFFSFLISVLERRRKSWFLEKLMGYILPILLKWDVSIADSFPLGERKLVWEGALWKHYVSGLQETVSGHKLLPAVWLACHCFVLPFHWWPLLL